MPISTMHPLFQHHIMDWDLCRDTVEGQSAIERRMLRYLPPPPGLAAEAGMSLSNFLTKRYTGSRYAFYASFAEFPEIVSPTLNAIMGLIHEKLPKIKLPSRLQYLLTMATPDGESLQELWERVTREILVVGRWVGLGEIVGDKIYACTYPVETMINWRLDAKVLGGRPSMIVLRELSDVPRTDDPFAHETQEQFRMLAVEEGVYTAMVGVEGKTGVEWQALDVEGVTKIAPMIFGKTLDHIPIYPINALDVSFDYGPMPLLGMSRRATSIYRKTADYHRALYIKGDPQPVIIGVDPSDAPDEIGGGKLWIFSNPDAKVDYLDIDGQGIPLMRQAINDQFAQFADETGMLFEGASTGYESGEALRRRQAMRQVTIKSLVINAAHGMETMLRDFALMQGLNPEEVTFEANLDFAEPLMTGQELRELIQAKTLGAPISNESLHDLMRRRQLVHREFGQELSLIKSETPLVEPPVAPTDPNSQQQQKKAPPK